MNRRSFLTRLGAAAIGAAAASVDPERLLWVPGAKTIVDFGATKQVLPATDDDMIRQATRSILSSPDSPFAKALDAQKRYNDLRSAELETLKYAQPREIKLEIATEHGLRAFRFDEKDKLIGVYSPEDLALLERPLSGVPRGEILRRFSDMTDGERRLLEIREDIKRHG